ncbi:MAG: hypothetical protein ACLUFT_12020, partial [Gemmiger formicilis]|uniref:hypothetical protein n=1 Tax=Gemmiger formicilis TaxID=745368 RepID=UPI0039911CAF
LQLNLVKLQESCKLEYNIVSQPQRGDCAFRQGGRKRRVSMRNAKQSIRRTVAGLLAGAMLLGMTPLAAFAEGSSSASGDWQFKAFGTSTAAGVNTIADGADINGKVTLNSCTIKDDGTIDKKGGKFVADSRQTACPSTTPPSTRPPRTSIAGRCHHRLCEPGSGRSGGFALMVRDSISGSGTISRIKFLSSAPSSSDGVEIKDAVGVRSYTGIISNETVAPTTSSRIVRRSARRPSSRATPTV